VRKIPSPEGIFRTDGSRENTQPLIAIRRTHNIIQLGFGIAVDIWRREMYYTSGHAIRATQNGKS